MLRSNLRTLLVKNSLQGQTRRYNFMKGRAADHQSGTDQYSAHSPLFMNRFKTEELRSKIFFEHPPVPNRFAKYFLLFSIFAIFSTGVRDKVLRRQKKFVREQERKLFRLVVPFVQAMEDVRFTAVDQRNYMIYKSVIDSINPNYFDRVRWRYHQEDIYVPEVMHNPRRYANGKTCHGQGVFNAVKHAPSTFYDKGLFDARELGYVY